MRPRFQRGFAALSVVASLALIFTLTLLMLLRSAMMDRDHAAKSQLRTDYRHREDAFLRALVAIFPQRAISCMKGGYAASDAYSWNTIFAQSAAMAGAANTLGYDLITELGFQNARYANPGDTSPEQLGIWITSLTGVSGNVTPGTTDYAAVFADPKFAGRIPPLLNMPSALQQADALRPVVSTAKVYANQASSLLADALQYPLYNLIPYPNIRFGYAAPGQPVVAKQNWWAFAVTFGTPSANTRGPVQPLTRYYVLSLYEIPSQLPIEAATFARVGTHRDGTSWNAAQISIQGGVYADQLSLSESFGTSRIAGKSSVTLAKTLTLGGTDISNDFDQAGVRERLQAQANKDTLPVALSSNSGRLTFLPIQRGSQFLMRTADSASTNPWDVYSVGAERCPITVKATSMVSLANQTPTTLRVRCLLPDNSFGELTLQRGVNWPTSLQPGGDLLPFQTELTDSNHSCLTFYPSLLNHWLVTQGAAPVSINHSIHFRTDSTADPLSVLPISDPLLPDHMAVIVRKGQDLTPFGLGLSIVSPLRVYVGDDLNATPAPAPPTGSGLPVATTYYPPMSIFAGELRIGTTSIVRPFELHGQVSTLAASGTNAWQPMDLKSGSDDTFHADSVIAELKPLQSPADLPPVHGMNWLIVIEEILQP